MPDIPRFPAFDVSSSLNKQLIFNQTAGFQDPLAGTGVSIPKSILVQTVSQNPNGTWSSIQTNEISPVKSQSEIISDVSEGRDSAIKSYGELASVYDQEILKFNNQINQKKAQIISLVSSAVSAGCSSPIGDATNINGVSCGIGSVINQDQARISVYDNMNNYSATTPWNPTSQEDITELNLGNGFESVITINGGSNLGSYRVISTDPNVHCLCTSILNPTPHLCSTSLGDPVTYTSADQQTCVGYGLSIQQIALEIENLRNQRDQYLKQVNDLKDLKTGDEYVKWNSRQAETALNEYNNKIKTSIVSISQYTDDIVMTGLIAYYDATQTYGIESSVETATNINAISKWNNLSGDGLYASPQTSVYQINLDVSDGPSVELNNYFTSTNQYFTIQSSFIDTDKIQTGDTSYTIESWVKITKDTNLGISSTTNGASIVGINSVYGYGLQVYKPSGIRVSFGERGSGRLTNNTNLQVNTWYHILATNESGVGSKIYINGLLDGSGSPINIISSTDNLQIGYAPSQIDQYFSGKISLIRIYNKKFTQEEVTKNFNANKERYGY